MSNYSSSRKSSRPYLRDKEGIRGETHSVGVKSRGDGALVAMAGSLSARMRMSYQGVKN